MAKIHMEIVFSPDDAAESGKGYYGYWYGPDGKELYETALYDSRAEVVADLSQWKPPADSTF